MSRCNCCNVILTPYELAVRSVATNDYMDVCLKCYSFMDDVEVITKGDITHEVGMDFAIIDYIDYDDYNGYEYYNS